MIKLNILPKYDTDIKGIIAYLFNRGKSISNYVETYGTEKYNGGWSDTNIVVDQLNTENGTKGNWCSIKKEGSFVQISFKKHFIKPYSYAFRSRTAWE